MSTDTTEIQIALALSKSLEETEKIQVANGECDESSYATLLKFQKDGKEALPNIRFISNIESNNAKLKRRK